MIDEEKYIKRTATEENILVLARLLRERAGITLLTLTFNVDESDTLQLTESVAIDSVFLTRLTHSPRVE